MKRQHATKDEVDGRMRLNRFLARAGVASRRRCDELIAAGGVRVNGKKPTGAGDRVDPHLDRVEIDGHKVQLPNRCEYVLLNKRRDTVVTRADERDRQTIYDGLADLRRATIAVGRLDRDTTGVLLLTDDGELAFRLTHPKYGVDKRYIAVVDGNPSASALRQLAQGIDLEDGLTAPAEVFLLPSQDRNRARIELVLHEGRKHQVKRMLLAVGHKVRSLRRASFAGLQTGDLGPGQYRHLHAGEIRRLRRKVGLDS